MHKLCPLPQAVAHALLRHLIAVIYPLPLSTLTLPNASIYFPPHPIPMSSNPLSRLSVIAAYAGAYAASSSLRTTIYALLLL